MMKVVAPWAKVVVKIAQVSKLWEEEIIFLSQLTQREIEVARDSSELELTRVKWLGRKGFWPSLQKSLWTKQD